MRRDANESDPFFQRGIVRRFLEGQSVGDIAHRAYFEETVSDVIRKEFQRLLAEIQEQTKRIEDLEMEVRTKS